MALQESGEMYLETIYVLSQQSPYVRSVDVAEHMGFSKPSVSRGMGILKRDGYLIMGKDGSLTLTEEGKQLAQKIYQRHTVIRDLLIHLGFDPQVAAQDACRMEHVISDATFQAICRHVKGM